MPCMNRVVLMLACTLSLAGCGKSQPTIPEEGPEADIAAPSAAIDHDPGAASAVATPATREGAMRLPSDMHLPGLSTVARASSWEARIAKYPAHEQDYLRGKNDMYFGALRFGSLEEQETLVGQGFPMPEEWLAARSIPDGELERLAGQGNRKAQMFLVDRVIDEIGPVLKERGFGDSPQDRDMFRRFTSVSATATMLLQGTCSPFVAYQNGVLLSSGTRGHDPAVAAGSFLVAKDLGDARADALSHGFFARHRQIDAQTALASYGSIRPARCG